MKTILFFFFGSVFLSHGFSQNMTIKEGSTISYTEIDYVGTPIYKSIIEHPENYSFLDSVNVYYLRHRSDGHILTGFMAMPKAEGKYPSVVYNRGGNRDFGELLVYHSIEVLGRIAANGFVVVATNYRGNSGGEGQEEFGGVDVNDVINLIKSLKEIPQADAEKVGLLGVSRGGMMNYLVLKNAPELVKASIQIGGITDLEKTIKYHKKIEKVIKDLIPEYKNNRDLAVWNRSAINWVAQLPKDVPQLILHSYDDGRVSYKQIEPFADSLDAYQVPYSLYSFKNDNHGIIDHKIEVSALINQWLNSFVKDSEILHKSNRTIID